MITRYAKLWQNINTEDLNYRIDWIRLARSKKVGPKTFFSLLQNCGNPTDALHKLESLAKQNNFSDSDISPSKSNIEKEIDELYKINGHIILPCDSYYPSDLLNISDPPLVLTYRGLLSSFNAIAQDFQKARFQSILSRETLAIVGARNASANGCYLAKILAKDLIKAGYNIVSGLARGIDTAAHIGSLPNNSIGVIATGIDQIYPKENAKLYQKMYEEGLIITEYSLGQQPLAQHFPQRNRIISGLSIGVIVIEAAEKSGTLITARYALEQGREVFAVPGSPLDPRCRGTNSLLKQGATIVESANDIVEAFNGWRKNHQYRTNTKSETQGELYDSINHIDYQPFGYDNDQFQTEDNEDTFLNTNFNTKNNIQDIYINSDFSENDFYKIKILEKLNYSPVDIEILQEMLEIPMQTFRIVVIELELEEKVIILPGDRIMLAENID